MQVWGPKIIRLSGMYNLYEEIITDNVKMETEGHVMANLNRKTKEISLIQ